MEYDKRNYQKTNDKKVLHKIRKHWVVVSTALLMALGGGAAATHVSANADTSANNGTATSTSTIKDRMNQQLQTPQKQNSQARPAVNNNVNNSQNNNSQNSNANIISQAKVLHNRILMNAGQNTNNSAQQSQTNGASQNNATAGQGRVAANAPKVNNNVHVNKQGNGISDIAKRISANENNGMANANANNNQVDVNRNSQIQLGQRRLLGSSQNPSDADHMFKGLPSNNGTFYQSGYEFLAASDLNSDVYDTNPSDYGAITIDYVDPSDGNLSVRSTSIGDKQDGTPFDKSFYLKNFPTSGNNAPYGYTLEKDNTQLKDGRTVNQIDSGNNISKFVGDETQYLVINLHRNSQPATNGNVLVQYLNESDNDKVLSYRMNSNSDGKTFDQQGFINDIPQGYTFDKWRTVQNGIENQSDQSPITNYTNNVQTLNVFVKPTNDSKTLTVNYINKSNGAIAGTKTINGNNGDTINYVPLNDFVPSGFNYASDASNNPSTFADNMQPATIYVKSANNGNGGTKKSSSVITNSDGTATIHYKNDKDKHGADISTYVITKKAGSTVDPDNYKDKEYLPEGWSDNSVSDEPSDLNSDITISKGKNQDRTIYVNNYNSKSFIQNAKATIQYVHYNKKNGEISDLPVTSSDPTGGKMTITGPTNSKIDYTPYEEFVPQGYQFYQDGPSDDSVIKNGETDKIEVVSNKDLAQPITVNYINQDGQKVNAKSDTGSISGSYGNSYVNNNIATGSNYSSDTNKMPSGYAINPSDANASYTIDSDAQIDNIMVHGTTQNSSDSSDPTDKNALVVKVNQRIVDKNNNVISNNVVKTYPVKGNTGSDMTINPLDYMPAPSSNYTMDPNDPVDKFEIEKGELDPLNKNTNPATDFQQDSKYPNEVDATFTYTQNNAVANVTYEDASDGNNIVGTSTVNGIPNTPMSDYYGTNPDTSKILAHLNSDTPYGYKYSKDEPSNPTNLSNGANYIIYVSNAHLQPKPTVQPRTGYGYITINYGNNLHTDSSGHTTGTIFSTVTTTNTQGHGFNSDEATELTSRGGFMPDVYNSDGATATSSDGTNLTYTSNPQIYNVDLTSKTAPTSTQSVSDDVDYEVLTPSDKEDTAATKDLKNKKLTPITIKGTDGSYINYAPYTNNLPNGYYYDGLATNSTIYTPMRNNAPVGTIYLKKAGENSNACGNYIPKNDNDHQGSNGQNVNPSDTDVKPSDGYYWPSDNAPVTDENPNQPINKDGYNWNYTMPSDYEGDNNGDVPNGYVPAWVPKHGTSDYEPGYVPSDIIPSGYIPGYVPNGRGGYVPGYVPSKTSDMPSGTQSDGHGGKTSIPSYVPGNIPSGTKGKTVPGYVPNMAPYSTADGTFKIQYIDKSSGNVISDVYATGQVGKPLVITQSGTGKQYIDDIPVGYTNPSDEGEVDSTGTPQNNPSHTYDYADGTHTIDIDVSKMVSGNVIYRDASDGYQVGSAQISGAEGDPVDFNTNDQQYMKLLPYGFNNPKIDQSNAHTLQNGADYVINVTNTHARPPHQPQQQKGYGQIIVNYIDANNNNDVVGTDSFIGKSGNTIQSPDQLDIGKYANQGGYIPYGYASDQTNGATSTDITNAQNAKFSSDKNNNPQTFNIRVVPDKTTNGQPTPTYTDKIAYQVVTKDGDKTLDYSKNGGVTTQGSQSDNGTPVTFNVTGKAGTDINYQPYQTDVPAGYEADGMGNHSAVIDAGHNGIGGAYDWLLLRTSPQTTSLGTITVNYKDQDTGHTDDSINLTGITGSNFNLSYYEDNLPTSIGSDVFVKADNNPLTFSNSGQTVDITVQKPQSKEAKYTNVHVYFVKADAGDYSKGDLKTTLANDLKSNNPERSLKEDRLLVPNSQSETMTGRVGDIFTPYAYEYNVPANTTFNNIAAGSDIDSFAKTDQNLVIAVDTTNGSF